MSKVITFSTTFPTYHPKAGEPTFFVEKIWESIRTKSNIDSPQYHYCKFEFDLMHWMKYSPKHHTIRAGNRWKAGEKFSPRVWSGKPYNSKQITIAPDIEINKVWNIEIINKSIIINGFFFAEFNKNFWPHKITTLAINDGLNTNDFENWFQNKFFQGQIICWNKNVCY